MQQYLIIFETNLSTTKTSFYIEIAVFIEHYTCNVLLFFFWHCGHYVTNWIGAS